MRITRRSFVRNIMSSQAKINASRANARKSTGPRTAEGKSVSRNNAYKHGMRARNPVAPGEDQAAFDARLAQLRAEFAPSTPSEDLLVQQAADASWRRERLIGIEAALLGEDPIDPAELERVSRWHVRMENCFFKAYKELQRLIQLRKEDRAKEGAEKSTPKSAAPGPLHTGEQCVYWWDPVTNKRQQIAGPPQEYDPAREIGPHKNNIPYSDPAPSQSNRRKF